MVTVDFYNHATETTQKSGGENPNYNTQLSFKNRVDDFYIAYITSKPLTMDVWLSKGQKAVPLGRCEVSLKPLIAGESSNRRPAVIEDWSEIIPVGSTRPLGKIKFVMRLRKGITE